MSRGSQIALQRGIADSHEKISRYFARASKTPQKHHSTQQQAGGADRRALAGFWGRQCENTMIWEPDRILSAFSLTVACWSVAAWEGGGGGLFMREKHS